MNEIVLIIFANSYPMPLIATLKEIFFPVEGRASFPLRGMNEVSDCHSDVFSCPDLRYDSKWPNS